MTEYTDRAAAVKAALQDHARDLEADLGKVARSRAHNVDWGRVQPIKDPGRNVDQYEAQKSDYPVSDGRLRSYQNAASGAVDFLGTSSPLAPAEKSARDECTELIAAIQQVNTHDDAAQLVATFN